MQSEPRCPTGDSPGAVADFVNKHLQKEPVDVFSRTWCSHSRHAKAILRNELGENFNVIEVDECPNEDEIMDYMAQTTGARTTPRIFIRGACIGGDDELTALAMTGALDRLLADAGVVKSVPIE
jgi:glutaredoxin 3